MVILKIRDKAFCRRRNLAAVLYIVWYMHCKNSVTDEEICDIEIYGI